MTVRKYLGLLAFVLTMLILSLSNGHSAPRKATNRVQVVFRGTENGPWKAYVFGAPCNGHLTVSEPAAADTDEPIELECK